jgi:hypothetical protein
MPSRQEIAHPTAAHAQPGTPVNACCGAGERGGAARGG